MDRLNILFASSEVVPFAKTGGLADVSGILPRVLAEKGHNLKVIMPKYGGIPEVLLQRAEETLALDIELYDRPTSPPPMRLKLYRLQDEQLPVEYLFVDQDEYFGRDQLYRDPATGKDFIDNDERFIFFCRGVLETLKKINWTPDIIHANDWQTGLLPTFLATAYKNDPFYKRVRTVFTIHNLAYQGAFPAESFDKLGLPKDLFYPTGPFEFWKKVNFMKSAIHYADLISTVSEKYAVEIQSSEEFGCGLEGVLRDRSKDIFGILNGVDYAEWSPAGDKYLPFHYSPLNLARKRSNKVELMARLGLPFREQAPLLGLITRLADQKGLDLIAEITDELFALDIQMVVLGTGERKYHTLFEKLEKKYPDKLKAVLMYDNEMSHWIEAGADLFLMPSRYEPCGLNQMYSLKYGTVPIVRATGGLADTVVNVDSENGTGTGFVFKKYKSKYLLREVKRAVALFGRKRLWRKIMKEGMAQDFSWHRSAEKYIELYRRAINKT